MEYPLMNYDFLTRFQQKTATQTDMAWDKSENLQRNLIDLAFHLTHFAERGKTNSSEDLYGEWCFQRSINCLIRHSPYVINSALSEPSKQSLANQNAKR